MDDVLGNVALVAGWNHGQYTTPSYHFYQRYRDSNQRLGFESRLESLFWDLRLAFANCFCDMVATWLETWPKRLATWLALDDLRSCSLQFSSKTVGFAWMRKSITASIYRSSRTAQLWSMPLPAGLQSRSDGLVVTHGWLTKHWGIWSCNKSQESPISPRDRRDASWNLVRSRAVWATNKQKQNKQRLY